MKKKKLTKRQRDERCWKSLGIDPIDFALRHLKKMYGIESPRVGDDVVRQIAANPTKR